MDNLKKVFINTAPITDVVRAERVCQSSSNQLAVARIVEASGGRVQDGLLHNDGDEAGVIVPHHVSSVAITVFVSPLPLPPSPTSSPSSPSLARHPRQHCHCPCCPLRHCPHHRPRTFIVRLHPSSCSCPPPAFNTPVAS